jgi:tripartite-type tricarboxylate transporter receptor subunit TctC
MKSFARCALALALTVPVLAAAQAPAWPAKPITLVVGSAPGGSNDTFARAIGKRLAEVLGQPVLVDNKPAGGGVLANAFVAKAQPDGYNLVVLSSTFTTGAAIRTNLQYDAVKSFKPVALLAKGPLLVTVPAESPYKTIGELVAAAKANPGKLNYGTSGAGSINHFATELFTDAAGIRMTHVPYKGMGPAPTTCWAARSRFWWRARPRSCRRCAAAACAPSPSPARRVRRSPLNCRRWSSPATRAAPASCGGACWPRPARRSRWSTA